MQGKLLGHLIPMLGKYGDNEFPCLVKCWVWYHFPSLGNSQRKHSENPVITHFIHKLVIPVKMSGIKNYVLNKDCIRK